MDLRRDLNYMVVRVDLGSVSFGSNTKTQMVLQEQDVPIEIGFNQGIQRKLKAITGILYVLNGSNETPLELVCATIKPLDSSNAPLPPMVGQISGGTLLREVEIHVNDNYCLLPEYINCPNGFLISQVGGYLNGSSTAVTGNAILKMTFIFE